tara:strand:+ start:3516 stop:5303 length:1788 start_codon:yes stop_codon:yes gene_type:complete
LITTLKKNINEVYIVALIIATLLPNFNALDNIGIRFFVVSILSILFLFNRILTKNFLFQKPFLFPILSLLIFGIYSLIKSTNFSESLILISQFSILIFSFYNIVNAYKQIKNPILFVSRVFIAAIFIESIYVFVDYFSPGSFTGISMNKNISAYSILIKLPFVFLCKIKKISNRKFIKITEIASIIAIFFLQSRSAILVMIFIYSIIFFIKKFRKLYISSYIIILLIFLVTLSFPNLIRDQKQFNFNDALNDTSLNYRLNYYDTASSLFFEKPLLGHGLGSWKYKSLRDYNLIEQDSIHIPYYVHNDFLQVLVENGIIGFSLFIFLFYYYILKSIRLFKSDETFIFTGFTILIYLFDSLFNFPFYRIQVLIPMILVLSLYHYNSKSFTNIYKTAIMFLFALLLASTVSFKKHKSLIIEDTLMSDYSNNLFTLNEEKLKFINYKIPNLTSKTVPVSTYISRYYINSNELEFAEELVDYGLSANPNDIMSKELKLKLLLARGSVLEALDLSKELFLKNPNSQTYAEIYFSILSSLFQVNDFIEIFIADLSSSVNVHKIFYKYYSSLPNLDVNHLKNNLQISKEMFPNEIYFKELLDE